MKKGITWILAVCLLSGSLAIAENYEEIRPIQKIQDSIQYVARPDISENFADDSILITVKNQYSVINGTWSTDDFYPVEASAVTDLRPIPEDKEDEYKNKSEFRTILCLTLANPGKEKVLQAIELLSQRDDVLAVEPNYIVEPCSTVPNDTYYSSQSSLELIQVDKVWDYTTGSSSVKVAVLDSGIYAHPDISGNLVSGYNYDPDATSTTDTAGHGTYVAGVIGAVGNNKLGVSGVCWKVGLQPYKFNVNSTRTDVIVSAINQAQLSGVPIINFSNTITTTYDSTITSLREAIKSYSGLFVCAAGNDSVNLDRNKMYPAALDLENILVVGACDDNGNRYSDSNWGSNWSSTQVDIFAPWHSWTVDLSNGYALFAKTSAATPLVAGVAALLKSYKPSLTTAQLKAAIMNGATSKAALKDKCVSGGMLNAYGALLQVTGNLKNYYTEVSVAGGSNIDMLSFQITHNVNKVYRVSAEFGPAAANNDLPLIIKSGQTGFIRSPASSALTSGGVFMKARFSMPSSSTLYSSDLAFECVTPLHSSYVYMKKYLMGDVDGDGVISSNDGLQAMKAGVDLITLTTEQKKRADVNFDGLVDSEDANLINQYSVSQIRTFW